ncbi:MAG: ACT domain-containing protein [Nitrospirae bacterium]|nr:ACT domain-containing protein [Candidatus Troglogloeales bacterium]
MGDTIRKVNYFHVDAPNKAGEGAKILSALWELGVNLLAFTGFPSGRKAQIDFIPEDTDSFKKAAKRAGLKLSVKKTGFLVQGSDRMGAVAEILSELAAAKINVTAIDAVTAGEGRYGAIFWVKTADVKKTAKTLGAF